MGEWTGHVLFWEPPGSPSSQSWIYHIFLQRGGLMTHGGQSETSPPQATAIDPGMERGLRTELVNHSGLGETHKGNECHLLLSIKMTQGHCE